MAKQKKSRRAAKKQKPDKVTATPRLSGFQKLTVDIYHCMKMPNKLRAMQMAGSKQKGKSGTNEAGKLFKKPHVREYHEYLKAQATEHAVRTVDDIIAELEKVAFSNIGDYLSFGEKGVELKDSNKLTRNQLAAVSEVTEVSTKYGKRKAFRLYDKPECLHLLGKRHGLFPNRQEHTGKDGKPIEHEITIIHFNKKK